MSYGDGLEVAMGGGREMFLPETMDDPEDAGKKGKRKDGKDLTKAWLDRYGNSGAYVWNGHQFEELKPAEVDHVLGLFERSHMEYEFDREKDAGREPSLAEMTVKAIDILSNNPQGFFLMVEGGRIDHAHHAGNAFRALSDAVAFDEAIKAAVDELGTNDTLMIATADHSHTFTINGYPKRGNPILGVAVDVNGDVSAGTDGKPYTTLSYANGPGGHKEPTPRPDVTMEQATDPDYVQQALVPLSSETHAGEDVGIYAIGPWAHLFQNTVEQNYIFHVMDFATKISERAVASAAGQPVKKAQAN
jgi:alkaline phosphatase